MNNGFSILGREIGSDQPPYVIAEMSANHLGDFQRAMEIVKTAAESGVDAVKLQTYTADTLTIKSERPEFKIGAGLWAGQDLHDLYRSAEMPWEWHEPLMKRGQELGVAVFSSPFDATAVSYLEALNCPAYKIASFELVDIPLIRRVAALGKPIIMSTGMATYEEISTALDVARQQGCEECAILHCISGYPTPIAEANLRAVADLSDRYNCIVGLSDHTLGRVATMVAVGLGACIIEKHLTLRRSDGGPDAAFSLEPHEMAHLVQESKDAWSSLGSGTKELTPSEHTSRQLRRSLYVVKPMSAGDRIQMDCIRSIRPANGLEPSRFDEVLGKQVNCDIAAGTPLEEHHLQ